MTNGIENPNDFEEITLALALLGVVTGVLRLFNFFWLTEIRLKLGSKTD